MTSTSTIFLVRHGDRFDHTNPEAWQATCRRLGHEPTDPPLSALGHQQARETAAVLAREGIECILCSPYLRVIQTAQPLAHLTGLPIYVEEGLAEFGHTPCRIPAAGERTAYFPEIDDTRAPLLSACTVDKFGTEVRLEFFRRMVFMAATLRRRYAGRRVALFSHAASLALVVPLLAWPSLEAAGTFAPCGIFELSSTDGGDTWRLLRHGCDNKAHVTSNDGATYLWGFHRGQGLAVYEALWQEACRLGPGTGSPGGDAITEVA